MLKYKIPQIVTLTLENFKFINLKNKKVNNLSFYIPFLYPFCYMIFRYFAGNGGIFRANIIVFL